MNTGLTNFPNAVFGFVPTSRDNGVTSGAPRKLRRGSMKTRLSLRRSRHPLNEGRARHRALVRASLWSILTNQASEVSIVSTRTVSSGKTEG